MSQIKTIIPSELPTSEMHQYLVTAVAPRPIALVSTVDEDGNANLAPYSFFNAFSSNPPIVVFSSNRRVRNNTTKDTLHNVTATRECVINMVSHDIVHQVAVASCEYPSDVNEFTKSGLTPLTSDVVRAPRVAEAAVQMECKVRDIISLGEHGGAGNLVVCEVVRFHVQERVLDERGKIDQNKIDLMGRMGRIAYVRASGNALVNIAQPVEPLGIGFDGLPAHIRNSSVLTGNDLAKMAGKPALPTEAEIAVAAASDDVKAIKNNVEAIYLLAKSYLHNNEIDRAFALLMTIDL